MKFKLLGVALIFMVLNCSENNFTNINLNTSSIQIEVSFDDNLNKYQKTGGSLAVEVVRVRVSGPDMAEINVQLSLVGGTARGTFEVPKGTSRLFEIEGLDGGGNILFQGSTTKNLSNDMETVNITAQWLQTSVTVTLQLPTANINSITVAIDGEGLGGTTRVENFPAPGTTVQRTISLPRGEKDFFIIASMVSANSRFELYYADQFINLTSTTANITIPTGNFIPKDEFEDWLSWHDDIFEFFWSPNVPLNDIFAAGFDVTDSGPVYLKSVRFEGLNWEGNSGNYQVVVYDETQDINQDLRFISSTIPAGNDGPVQWDLLWGPPEEGVFTNILLAGIKFNTSTGWPEVAYDTSAPSESCFWWDADVNQWFFMSDGDFGITLIVQDEAGQELTLKPSKMSDLNLAQRKRIQ